jgi:hypothetical protein
MAYPIRLADQLRARDGLEADVRPESNRDVAILTRFEGGVATPWSASGLAKGIKEVLERCAASMDIEDAEQLRKASTHWVRYTQGSHALNGRPGAQGRADPGRAEQPRTRLDRNDVRVPDD